MQDYFGKVSLVFYISLLSLTTLFAAGSYNSTTCDLIGKNLKCMFVLKVSAKYNTFVWQETFEPHTSFMPEHRIHEIMEERRFSFHKFSNFLYREPFFIFLFCVPCSSESVGRRIPKCCLK